MPVSWAQLFGLLGWGTLVGVDLVSFPQALLSRPLIAGAGAGLVLGEPEAGFKIGLVLELFALDVLPVGAARYPDYGAGVVGAVVLASGAEPTFVLGIATLYALLFATLGGWSLQWLRRVNGRTLESAAAGLAAGDAATIRSVQYRGVAGDLVRSALLTALAVGVAFWLRPRLPLTERMELVSAVAVGTAVAAAASGAIRSAGREARLRWLAAGAGLGLLMAALR
ncbi:MAG: PTS sugar transporter subunit IIC [Gemmatimonadetes bacterium]|nr:PTS sugar transporter subunit IIC [Gemmatimonadota bacterium]